MTGFKIELDVFQAEAKKDQTSTLLLLNINPETKN